LGTLYDTILLYHQNQLFTPNGLSHTPTNELAKPWHFLEYPILVPSKLPSKLKDVRCVVYEDKER